MIERRFLGTAALGVLGGPQAAAQPSRGGPLAGLAAHFAAVERQTGGRLGVAVEDTRTGVRALHRAGERFPMASTVKLLLAGATLARVDRGEERLDRRIAYAASDLVPWSPVLSAPARVAEGAMPVSALLEAMLSVSDNTATNLLLAACGGPAALTAFLRTIGDTQTRLDRAEPALNEARPGDPRDTTTPAAFLAAMRALALGDALAPASRERLVLLLKGNQTGGPLLRARLPAGWQVADRTGAGGHGTRGAVGIVWPAGRAEPVLVAAFLTEGPESMRGRDAILAEVGGATYAALAAASG